MNKRSAKNPKASNLNRFVVLISGEEATNKVAYYCSKRLKRNPGVVELLYCDQNAVAPVQFRSLGELASEEARENAEKILDYYAKNINELSGSMPIIHYQIGFTFQALFALIDQKNTKDIPTWLIIPVGKKKCYNNSVIIDLISKYSSQIKVPIVIIPNDISYDSIDSLN